MRANSRREPDNHMGIHKKQFASRQVKPARGFASRSTPVGKPLAHARERCIPLSRAHFSSTSWQHERLLRLNRICRCLDRGRAAGKRLRRMVRLHAWRWRGRHYKCDPARAIHFKASTILRVYRIWRNGGRTLAALALHYWRGNRKVSVAQVVKLSKLCLVPETRSFSAAYRRLKTPGATESAYRYATPVRLRAALAGLLALRRRGQALERAARRILEGLAK